MNLKQKKADPPETLAISMLEVFAERYDMSKPEVQKEIASQDRHISNSALNL